MSSTKKRTVIASRAGRKRSVRSSTKFQKIVFLMPALFFVGLQYNTSSALPVPPLLPQRCIVLCNTTHPFDDCMGRCPSVQDCQKVMGISNFTEFYNETSSDGFAVTRQEPCEPHCWRDNEYTEMGCMKDCPGQWCRQYSGVPASTTPLSSKKSMLSPTAVEIWIPALVLTLAIGLIVCWKKDLLCFNNKKVISNTSQPADPDTAAALFVTSPTPTVPKHSNPASTVNGPNATAIRETTL